MAASSFARAIKIPTIIYGTAWKKEKTSDLVYKAIKHGFRAIDTACQPKHYNENGVGQGLQRAYADGIVSRKDLFIQTKFTSIDGQDISSVPYNRDDELHNQVITSLNVSLTNLRTDYLDSLLIHSPMRTFEATLSVWRVFETFVKEGRVRAIGLSNTYDIHTLERLYNAAEIKPSFLQNRFYSKSGFDIDIREFCQRNDIHYQSFWTLTANKEVIRSRAVNEIATEHSSTREQIFYKFVRGLGIIPLSGTTSEEHMADDVAVESGVTPLTEDEKSELLSMLLSS